jgi:hypothetical protein
MPKLPDPRPGDPIEADHIRALSAAVAEPIPLVPPLAWQDGAISVGLPTELWIRITGPPTGTKHPWREQVGAAGGAWADGARIGTVADDPAYEAGLSTATLTNKIVRAWRDEASFSIRFAYGPCP